MLDAHPSSEVMAARSIPGIAATRRMTSLIKGVLFATSAYTSVLGSFGFAKPEACSNYSRRIETRILLKQSPESVPRSKPAPTISTTASANSRHNQHTPQTEGLGAGTGALSAFPNCGSHIGLHCLESWSESEYNSSDDGEQKRQKAALPCDRCLTSAKPGNGKRGQVNDGTQGQFRCEHAWLHRR